MRLTMFYGCVFLASGAALLAVTYLLVDRSTDDAIFSTPPNKGVSKSPNVIKRTFTGSADPHGVHQLPSPAPQLEAQIARLHAGVLHQLLVQSAIALAIMALASIALGYLLAGRALRPLRTITTAARGISATNLHERLALEGPDDELTELGDTFDELLGRLEGSFAAQRQFVANASHELRSPLARQRTLAEVALSDPAATVESLRASYTRVLAAGEEQEILIEALLTLATGQRGLDRRETFDLSEVTRDVLLTPRPDIRRNALRIEVATESAPVSGARALAERLVANLVDNAARYNVKGGTVVVATGVKAGQAFLSVANTGPTIPTSDVARLLQPFQRLDTDRTNQQNGHGLGLAIVQAIAHAHGATLSIRSQPEGGLNIEVRFPVQPATA